ncbi:DUF3311 domain-containing protein [Sciscionella marina]|uniref:DUF3311 domain-containing protein n=1 Tax=Sciscionella marina TaxID=508770 RepID=UPI0003649B6E|nr:DUF3311 domain-containing protein [Sciscionella marina]
MSSEPRRRGHSGLRLSWWNLVLLVPLIVLFTPMYNADRPRLFGMPYFYWHQFLFVFIGVISVAIVYLATRDKKPKKQDTQENSGEDGK